MKKSDYVTKIDTMIDNGIMKGTYVETTDNTLKELLQFQDFLYRNLGIYLYRNTHMSFMSLVVSNILFLYMFIFSLTNMMAGRRV